MNGDIEFAVLDVETTGFSPKLYDKIVEVGIVRLEQFKLEMSYSG